jgi:hypothetical protein
MKESVVVHAQQILGALVMQGFTVRLQNPAHGVYEISYQQRIRGGLWGRLWGRRWEWETLVQAVELFHQRGTPTQIAARYYAEMAAARTAASRRFAKNEDPEEPANA